MKHIKRHKRIYLNLTFSLGMVFFLLLSFTQFHAVLPQFSDDGHNHNHSEISHFAEDELNACHRSLYHNDQINGCSHSTHLTDSNEECSFCKIHFQSVAEKPITTTFTKLYLYKSLFKINKTLIRPLLRLAPPVRGPPFN